MKTDLFIVAQRVKNPPVMQETWVQFLSWEDPLKKGKATHSSILAGLKNPMDCIVHSASKSQTQLSNFHFHQITNPKRFPTPP